MRVSYLAMHLDGYLAELDINPLMVLPSGQGVKAVDALVVFRSTQHRTLAEGLLRVPRVAILLWGKAEMTVDDIFAKPIDVDELLLSKQIEPLAPEHLPVLEKIAALDVSNFNEPEVRTWIIDPIIRVLGYDAGTIFSATLGHQLKFLDKDRFPDYQFTLWNENFWLIEAKRPQFGQEQFDYDDLKQAIEYSIHPTVNAALVVLCDGLKFEIFDREVSVETPLLRVRIADLPRDFNRLRAVLEPMQIWFFQKRRIIRLLDKVFDKEFNMYRVEEFSALIDRRLRSKHQVVIENFRANVKPNSEEQRERASNASIEDLTELYLFSEQPIPITNAVNRRLVQLSQSNSFWVIRRIFPDQPRDANDIYMAQALTYLMGLESLAPHHWLGSSMARPGWSARWDGY